ncbi:MAG: hypothetical protein ACKN9V_09405, partial [Pseudomonadota bacterium]
MGFYLDLVPKPAPTKEFKEVAPPSTYWVLYAIGVFALVCMVGAAHHVLGGLIQEATLWDWIILGILGGVVLLFLFVGFKLAALRRFVRVDAAELQTGYFCLGFPLI